MRERANIFIWDRNSPNTSHALHLLSSNNLSFAGFSKKSKVEMLTWRDTVSRRCPGIVCMVTSCTTWVIRTRKRPPHPSCFNQLYTYQPSTHMVFHHLYTITTFIFLLHLPQVPAKQNQNNNAITAELSRHFHVSWSRHWLTLLPYVVDILFYPLPHFLTDYQECCRHPCATTWLQESLSHRCENSILNRRWFHSNIFPSSTASYCTYLDFFSFLEPLKST